MAREEYDLNEQAYQETLKGIVADIDKGLDEEEKKNDLKLQSNEAQANAKFILTEKTRGITEKDREAHKNALELNRQGRERMKQIKRERRIREVERKIEIQIFGKKWGRLEARELAYGASEPEVIRLKELKHQEDRHLEAERQKYQRPSLENPHKLETLKGKYAEHFNEKDRTR
jgi:hypothetical protein